MSSAGPTDYEKEGQDAFSILGLPPRVTSLLLWKCRTRNKWDVDSISPSVILIQFWVSLFRENLRLIKRGSSCVPHTLMLSGKPQTCTWRGRPAQIPGIKFPKHTLAAPDDTQWQIYNTTLPFDSHSLSIFEKCSFIPSAEEAKVGQTRALPDPPMFSFSTANLPYMGHGPPKNTVQQKEVSFFSLQ